MPNPTPPSVGAVFAGDFRIVRPLKEGGMGAVYVAEQISTGAQRALKLMHPHLVESEKLRQRFEQEARVGSRIDSDYVVQVIAAGVEEGSGVPWLAMELLQGEDLDERVLREGALSAAATLEVFTPLCHAVGAAHRAGIVHRDLKPENIFLAKSRRPGEPFTLKVLDFGIARIAAEAKTSSTGAVGTPLWMAPEQTVRGGQIAATADVWALGLIAFYLLTGVPYWRAANDEEASLPVLLRELAIEPIDPASARAAVLGRGGKLPPGFDEWFARCVVREIGARFSDASACFAALQPVLARQGVAIAATVALPVPVPVPVPVADPASAARPLARVETAPGAAISNPTFDGRAPAPKRSTIRWIAPLVAVGVVAGGAAGLLYFKPWSAAAPAPAASSSSSAAASASSSQPPPRPSASAREENAAAAADQIGKQSPMVSFPSVQFSMGSNNGGIDERPVHDVTFPAFAIDVAEVTMQSWDRCVAVGKCTPAGRGTSCNAGHPDRLRHPVNCVDLNQATAYCAWLGRRLPTEDEWEYAAGGKDKRLYAWGDQPPQGRACWSKKDGTCPVGSFASGNTPDGLENMTGNVREWTSSDYCFYDKPGCTIDLKVTRGGTWLDSDARVFRNTVRQQFAPATRSEVVGFRCARAL
jgi:formylglycine-generating enzyme required for sulfatase activity